MKDLVYAVSVGKIGEHLVLDLDMIEDNYSDSDMPMAISPRNGEILLLQMDGEYTKEELEGAFKMAAEAGKEIGAVQRNALKRVYENVVSKYNGE